MEGQFHVRLRLFTYLSLLVSLLHNPSPCLSDPNPLQDFCVADLQAGFVFGNGYPCKPPANVTDDDFFYSKMAEEGNTTNPFGLSLNRADVRVFPGLNTLGLSILRADIAPGGIIPPHVHPRSAELVLVIKGKVLVGFVTTANRLFSKVVRRGEVFVVPMGLMHFQQNVGNGRALLFATFGSQLPGLVIAPHALFGSKPPIPTELLAKTFQMESVLVDSFKSKFGN